MKDLDEKGDMIQFDAKTLKELFAPEFLKQDLLTKKDEFSELRSFRQSSSIYVVEDYISFATENNWCQEDLDAWEVQMSSNNPTFQYFVSHLKSEGYVNFDDAAFGTLWVISRIILSKDLVDLGPADDFGKVAKNTSYDWFYKMESDEAKRERAIERRLNDGEPKPSERRGPKKNDRHTVVQVWIKRLYPWLKTLPGMEYEKDVQVLIGLLFHHAGFEFYGQYARLTPRVKHERKCGKSDYIDIPFSKYLHNRVKAIYYSMN